MLRIGTSGWHYTHWVGPFYPKGTRATGFLAHYAGQFDTVEINNSFYRLPSAETFAAWRDATPDGFLFACKASRYITHMKKLKDPADSTARFFEAAAALGPKLGPILFQLPPRWHADAARLDAFLAALPRRHRYVFEFRDESWFDDEIYAVLHRHGAALCLSQIAGHTAPPEATGGFDYVRLHGPEKEAYRGRYSDAALDSWAESIAARLVAGRDVYCYFDNDETGHAAKDAARLRDRLAAVAGAGVP